MHTKQLFPVVCFCKDLIPDAASIKYWFSLTSVKALIFLLWLNTLSNKIFWPFWASINYLSPSFHIVMSSSCMLSPRSPPTDRSALLSKRLSPPPPPPLPLNTCFFPQCRVGCFFSITEHDAEAHCLIWQHATGITTGGPDVVCVTEWIY